MAAPEPAAGPAPAVLGGGCFWCTEAVFADLAGVTGVRPGYAGGSVVHPSYEAVCTGRTGHAEVVEVTFDPARIGYADLLDVFFATHDPTTRDRQGADVGSQYRSVVLYRTDAQRAAATAKIAELDAARLFGRPIVTEVAPLAAFYPAEDYHHRYFERHPEAAYCQAVIAPKLAKFRRKFAARIAVER